MKKYIIVAIISEILLYLTIWYIGQNFYFNQNLRVIFVLLSCGIQTMIWHAYFQNKIDEE